MPDDTHEISLLLADWSRGDERAREELLPLVYSELRKMAKSYMRRQQPGHTFQTTELIHEAYLKIARNGDQGFQNRAHFFGVAAKAMRHILVDYARSKQSEKHGGGLERVDIADDSGSTGPRAEQLVALDDALSALAELDERKSRVVELRFFGGLTNEEIAGLLNVSVETVKRDWRFARNWLLRELSAKS
jgi:RNA polymerase sigma factor (TIGR02999 family)